MDPELYQRASEIVNDWDDVGCTEPITLAYKSFSDKSCYIDVYLPTKVTSESRIPILLYFHGGGMTVGNRRSWFPTWMLKRAIKAGCCFVSADYRLMPPASGHDILEDIHDLFRFLSEDLDTHLGTHCKADPTRIIVAGSSAGSFCAYMAALHANPKPIVVLSLYGMGGNVLIPQYLSVKTEPFFMGREILDIKTFRAYLHPFLPGNTHIADSRLAYDPETGIPSNPRMPLCRILLQDGIWLDYWTGDFDELDDKTGDIVSEGFSRRIRKALERDESRIHPRMIPSNNLHLFPQFNVTAQFPPSFLVHGELDSAVKKTESENMKALLDAVGVEAHLRIVPGQEHSFEYTADPDSKYQELFDEMFDFVSHILKDKGHVM
ncbi:alpha/beta-hydrolase [Schizopora paradoxa]|uniref:Alpha/beta-hydrolase n=1 Tax=Schizopora paradoxa TaxID=27342 RepID=A0A0H2RZ04_9AGAM|nr:alpha/beta-hydrolase [Schizopora paradoxa]